MYDVVVYKSSVLNLNKHPRKESCLQSFADGAVREGANVHIEKNYVYRPAKLAVILGWVTQDKTTPNILLRQQIVEQQKNVQGRTMCIDAGCWKYADTSNTYLRYSLDGPFYDQAEYANKNSSSEKWNSLSKHLNVELKPWKQKGKHILICMQRDGGFSMKNLDPVRWLENKLSEIRRYSNRLILIRPHPGKVQDLSRFARDGIDIVDSKRVSLIESMYKAHAAIFFNSSSAVAAVCEGVPIFIDDKSCVAAAVANTDISKIETPSTFDREQWVYDLAAAHWSDAEAASGQIYRKFRHLIL